MELVRLSPLAPQHRQPSLLRQVQDVERVGRLIRRLPERRHNRISGRQRQVEREDDRQPF